MVEKNPQPNIDLKKIPDYLSYEAMEAKYDFDFKDQDRFLGKGSFGSVHLFVNKNDKQEYAGKHMQCSDLKDFDKLLNEKVFQHKLRKMPCVM
jgi:hypothetical protein